MEVGGVRFKPFSADLLQTMKDNHRLVCVRSVKRRESMEAWSYGSMTAAGSREATGGRKGDTYAEYTIHSGKTVDDINALFRHAQVCHNALSLGGQELTIIQDADTLMAYGSTIYPPLKREMASLGREAGTNKLGLLGGTLFYCWNYISVLHIDHDAGLGTAEPDKPDTTQRPLRGKDDKYNAGAMYPCVQLDKFNCGKDDYNFALLQYGIAIRTEENTIW